MTGFDHAGIQRVLDRAARDGVASGFPKGLPTCSRSSAALACAGTTGMSLLCREMHSSAHWPSASWWRAQRVLEVGCGTGRWSRLLRDLGADVHATDLSEAAILRDREQIPGVVFESGDFLALELEAASFDLGVSVTVLQHLPFESQEAAVGKLADVIRPGGIYLMLENTHDRGTHVFARTIPDWISLFGEHGFAPLYARGYEFNLPIRLVDQAARLVRKGRDAAAGGASHPPDATSFTYAGDFLRAKNLVYGPAIALSYPAETVCRLMLPDGVATHAAFVFRRME